jgi:hypothetical protein
LEIDTHFKDEINRCFESLKLLIDESFTKLGNNPAEKEKILNLWKANISEFITYTFKASEQNNNKDLFKAFTKVLVFKK